MKNVSHFIGFEVPEARGKEGGVGGEGRIFLNFVTLRGHGY